MTLVAQETLLAELKPIMPSEATVNAVIVGRSGRVQWWDASKKERLLVDPYPWSLVYMMYVLFILSVSSRAWCMRKKW